MLGSRGRGRVRGLERPRPIRAHLQGAHLLLELRVDPPEILCGEAGGHVLGGPARRGLRAVVQVRARRALLREVLQRLVHERAELLLAHRLPQPVLHLDRVRVRVRVRVKDRVRVRVRAIRVRVS